MNRWIQTLLLWPWVGVVAVSVTCSEEEGPTCCDCRCCGRTVKIERETPWPSCQEGCQEQCRATMGCEVVDQALECGQSAAAGGSGTGGSVPDASFDGPPLYPEDGHWTGIGISFHVSGGGTRIAITLADYGTCTNGDCYASNPTTCSSCETDIIAQPGHAVFEDLTLGCSGVFTSTVSAYGSCELFDETCQCTMQRSWTASL